MTGLTKTIFPNVRRNSFLRTALLLAALSSSFLLRADEPYARTRDYDLQHSKITLRFDLGDRKVMGNVTHTLFPLRENLSKLSFDSVGLQIAGVAVNSKPAKFETTSDQLLVTLDRAARIGEKLEVAIRYEGHPKKGIYFILPDKDYPHRPKQIWTQGESEDTRYYLPTYDYPNDRLTTEMIVTVPKDWVTISNGKLVRVDESSEGMKTWDWKESVPSSTYLISLVAGEFDEVKEAWRGIPLTYYAPKGRGDRLKPNYGRTPQMLDLFTKRLGVNYPWEKYAQSMVDDFIAGGMENSSATTNTSASLVDPRIVPEYFSNQDNLISHELAHQWFGDYLTCKDWGNIWLNEGFATFLERVWNEEHFGADAGALDRWDSASQWAADHDLFSQPIVRHNFDDSSEFDGNAYGKGGWVLYMLKHQVGDEAFWRGMKHYVEKFRGRNVVTSDYAKAMEESTGRNLDQFFDQWIYGAGAPNFDLRYTYDAAKHEVKLEVKQTQKIEGRVGIFRVPVEVEITTASGAKNFPITVSKENETFTFPASGAPLMILFDKNFTVLKTAEFHKENAEWIYQLQHAGTIPDRLDAARALGKIKNNDAVVAALGAAALGDSFWGVREQALRALGQIGGTASLKHILAALSDARNTNLPWLRQVAVQQLGNFGGESEVATKLVTIAHDDRSYRARAAALGALAKTKAPQAYDVLQGALAVESPDEILRRAALQGFAALGEDRAIPTLVAWSAPGKPIELRQAAISSLGKLDKKNKEITKRVEDYLNENRFPVRMASVFALGKRGDPSAIPALSAMLKSDDLSITFAPLIEAQITRLKQADSKPHSGSGQAGGANKAADNQPILQKLDSLEKTIAEMSERLKSVEKKLVAGKN